VTHPRSSLRARRLLAAALAAASLAACGSIDAGAAAVVGDRRISVTDVQQATRDIEQGTSQDGGLPQAQVLSWLILAPEVLKEASAHGMIVSETDAKAQLPGLADPSPEALLAAQCALSINKLGQSLGQAEFLTLWGQIIDRVEASGVSINPRYGVYTKPDVKNPGDGSSLFTLAKAVTPNWISATPSGSPSPESSPSP
jgi:hypothetical protein